MNTDARIEIRRSASVAQLLEAVAKAQAKLKNPPLDSTNPHYKSKFSSLGAVRGEVIPAFTEFGLSVMQWPIARGEEAGCITHVGHSSGEWMESDFLLPVDKHNVHGFASAVTYAKRIALQSVAGIVGENDDDGNAAVGDNTRGIPKDIRNSATHGMFEALSIDVQNDILDCVHRVSTLIKKGDIAGAYDELLAYDDEGREDRKAALWSRFDSKERSAMTAEGKKRRQQTKEAA